MINYVCDYFFAGSVGEKQSCLEKQEKKEIFAPEKIQHADGAVMQQQNGI